MDLVSAVRQAIKLGGQIGEVAGEAALEVAYPWLKLPIINWIWKTILEKYVNAFIKAIMDKSTELIIPIIDSHAASVAQAESDRLQKMIEDKNTKQAELEAEILRWEEKYEILIRMRRATPD